jgi:RES domain-containing protein
VTLYQSPLIVRVDPSRRFRSGLAAGQVRPVRGFEACDIVDLTDPIEIANLRVTEDGIGCAWEKLATAKSRPPSWALAQRLINRGAAGIQVRRFAPGAAVSDTNAVVLRWSDAPHKVTVIDSLARLPVDNSSWR